MERKSYTVGHKQAGLRLFEYVALQMGASKKQAQAAIDAKRVLVNGRRVWIRTHALREDDRVEILRMEKEPKPPSRVPVLWQDADYLVVNKPAYLLTNASLASVEALLRRQEGNGGICAVHRLDKETSGCVLFAKSPGAKKAMIPLFQGRDIMKIYRAATVGHFPTNRTEIRTDIDGYVSTTLVKVLDSNKHASYLELRIETGRTHQIRRHLADQRHPVLGDKKYAGTGNELSLGQPRQMLHAYRLVFPHPGTGRPVRATAPLPGDFKRCLAQLKLR